MRSSHHFAHYTFCFDSRATCTRHELNHKTSRSLKVLLKLLILDGPTQIFFLNFFLQLEYSIDIFYFTRLVEVSICTVFIKRITRLTKKRCDQHFLANLIKRRARKSNLRLCCGDISFAEATKGPLLVGEKNPAPCCNPDGGPAGNDTPHDCICALKYR